MKKALIIITTVFLLAGCNFNKTNDKQFNESDAEKPVVTENTKLYTDEEFNISFEYPNDWEIIDNQERFDHAVTLVSNGNEYMFFDYQAESYDEYENRNSKAIEEAKISVEETTLVNYPAKRYGMHGGMDYLVEVEEHYVRVNSEMNLTQKQIEGLEEILNSLTFAEPFTVQGNKVTINNVNLTFKFTDNCTIEDNTIEFGPETLIPESPTDKDYTRPNFELTLIDQKSFNEILEFAKENPDIAFPPTPEKINDLNVATWVQGGLCEYYYFEIIGETQNIQIKDRNCSSEVDTEEYISNLLESVE